MAFILPSADVPSPTSKHSARHPATSNGVLSRDPARTRERIRAAVSATLQTEPGCACPSGGPRISITNHDSRTSEYRR